MGRRQFIGSTLATGVLAGCARPGDPLSAPPPGRACIAPVRVEDDRIIRTVAGLRPYRDEGFVVRAEPLGTGLLVHNYGHGGAGITLSWGSSRLAVDLGLPGHAGPVAVLGAGVMGLSTARLAQEAGHAVTIYTDRLPPHTTSNTAGGQVHPASHYSRGRPSKAWFGQYAAAMAYSWRRFQLLVGEDYGIRWLPTYESGNYPLSDFIRPYQPDAEDLAGAANPFARGRVRRYHTMYVETGRYLRRLIQDFLAAGGRFAIRRFGSPAEVAELPETVTFNCTGLGARDLFGDEGMTAKRGQLAILLPQPEIGYAYSIGASYMFPRPDVIVLGGTFETDVWDAEPTAEGIAAIMRRNRALLAGSCRA